VIAELPVADDESPVPGWYLELPEGLFRVVQVVYDLTILTMIAYAMPVIEEIEYDGGHA
jgi:hypothetical protein